MRRLLPALILAAAVVGQQPSASVHAQPVSDEHPVSGGSGANTAGAKPTAVATAPTPPAGVDSPETPEGGGPVPEPHVLLLVGTGLVGVALTARRTRRQQAQAQAAASQPATAKDA